MTDQCSSPSPLPFSPNAVRPAIRTHTHIREVSSRPPLNVLIIGFGGGVMAQRMWEGCHDTPRVSSDTEREKGREIDSTYWLVYIYMCVCV